MGKMFRFLRDFVLFLGLLLLLLMVLMVVVDRWQLGREAPISIEASNVITELRSMKAGVVMYLADGIDSPDKFPYPVPRANNIGRIAVYMDRPEKYVADRYGFYVEENVLWVGGNLTDMPFEYRQRLQDRAEKTGLYGTSSLSIPPASDDKAGLYKKEDPAVWMRVK